MVLDSLIEDGYNKSGEICGLPVNLGILFSNHKGEYKKKVEKRQRRLLDEVRYIKPFLDEGEDVLLVTKGCSPMSFFEQFFTGWIIYMLKHSHFIFTNKRIFHVPVKLTSVFSAKARYRDCIAQILYSDCEFIKQKGRTLKVKYKSGKKESFFYIKGKEKKKAKVLAQSVSLAGEPSMVRQRAHLCPRCRGILVKDVFECPHCQLKFKNKKEAMSISVWCPGGGYFYTRHPVLGVFDALGEAYLMLLICLFAFGNIEGTENSIVGIVIFGIVLIIEKIVTIYHSNHFLKEFIPVDKVVVPLDRASDSVVVREHTVEDINEITEAVE